MEVLASVLSSLGAGTVILFFIQRYFSRRDKREETRAKEQQELLERIETSMNTLRLLSYARMSEETERLLTKGFATPTERRFLKEMYENYKAHGWNGDMDERLEKVYALRTDHA